MNNVAILAGCEDYADQAFENLVGVSHDIRLMHEALIKYCGCEERTVFEITKNYNNQKELSGVEILNNIRDIADNKCNTEIHNLFFYYSGHGITQGKELHLIPSNAILHPFFGTIPVSVLKDALDAFRVVKHIIIILDICQENYIAKGSISSEIDCFPSKSTVIFYSCSPNQSSYMLKDGKGSLYTKFFVDALSSSERKSTIKDISSKVKKSLNEYCHNHGITQSPHTETFDISLADVIIANNRGIPFTTIETAAALDLNKSIWLKDAEQANGDQARFKTFTGTTIVNKFVDRESEFWGIASVKGIGKTFLLQVKRIKMSKNSHCFPDVKPCRDNNWATECIKFSDSELAFRTIESYSAVKLLWKYSLVCFTLRCWIVKQKNLPEGRRNKGYGDIVQWIEDQHYNEKLSALTYQFLTDESFQKLQLILEFVVEISGWPTIISTEYKMLQRLGQLIISAISPTSKKTLALFIDKIDQAMRQPNSEHTLDCPSCSKRETILTCNDTRKDSSYCIGNSEDICAQRTLCCYGCETYADPYAGAFLRIDENGNLRNRHYNYWQRLQLALIEAVTDIRSDFDGCLKVIYTVRLEACNYMDTIWGDQRSKIMGLTCILDYTRDEQKKIYQECIEHQDKSLLYLPELAKRRGSEDKAFVGVDKICHPYVSDASEYIFDIIYRHSFDRTRDIQDYGQALTARMQDIKSTISEAERGILVKEIIEETAARLAYNTNRATRSSENSYYFEKMPNMPSYWADPENFERLLNKIDRNLLFLEDMRKICREINQIDKCSSCGCAACSHHPFSALKNLGMLGYIVLSENQLPYSTQNFLSAKDVTYFHDEDCLQINENTMYLIHPALTKSIEKLRNDKKIMHFSGFLIGKDIQVQQSILRAVLADKRSLSKDDFEKEYYRFVDLPPLSLS